MNVNPAGLRAMNRGLKSHTLLDGIARHYEPARRPIFQRGKFLNDDQSAKGVQDYLADRFVSAQLHERKGPYWPRQIARNFWRTETRVGKSIF